VLDVWNGLNLLPCEDIYSLVLNPQKVYSDAVNKLAEVPEQKGRFQVSKAAYIQTLEIPVPDLLYRAARTTRQMPFTCSEGIWQTVNGKVELIEKEATALIASCSVYTSSPDKIALAEKLKAFCDSFNSLSLALKSDFTPPLPGWQRFFIGKFILRQDNSQDPFTITVDPAYLKTIIQG
jgi:hypothetical protein